MRMQRSVGIVLLLLGVAAMTGCSKKNPTSPMGVTPGATATEQAKVLTTIAAAPTAIEDGLLDSVDPTTLDAPAGMMAAIRPITFWRSITHRERTLDFVFSDPDPNGRPTTAVVTINKTLTGRFNILTGVPGSDQVPMDSTLTVIHKPLEDHWVRRVMLRRGPQMMPPRLDGTVGGSGPDSSLDEGEHEMEWRVVATSGVKVTSKDALTQIVSMRVVATGVDTTITDPLAFIRLRKVFHFIPGDSVMVTVTTLKNDDVVTLQHSLRRFRFHSNGDNTYTGVWRSGVFLAGLRHFGVNAFSHGTLFDDSAPYDSQAWIFPYSMEPEALMSDHMP